MDPLCSCELANGLDFDSSSQASMGHCGFIWSLDFALLALCLFGKSDPGIYSHSALFLHNDRIDIYPFDFRKIDHQLREP